MNDAAFAWAAARLPDRSDLTFTRLKAEASFRSFYRVADHGDGEPVVLMVSPPEKERNDQFEALSRVFCDAGIPVPDILARDPDRGFYVLRDVGATDLESLYGGPWEAAALEAAIETLIRLQTVHDPAIAPYTLERLEDELGIFEEWFAGALLSSAIPDSVGRVFRLLVDHTATQPQCCVHRDYHSRNLLFAPDTGRLGVVDFQDALIGPVSYDLASLLHDCYHEFGREDIDHWREWYRSRAAFDLEAGAFARDVDWMAVQRQLKAVGIFARLKLRDGRATHLHHIPPVLDHLRGLTRRYPALEPLADWLGALDDDHLADALAAA